MTAIVIAAFIGGRLRVDGPPPRWHENPQPDVEFSGRWRANGQGARDVPGKCCLSHMPHVSRSEFSSCYIVQTLRDTLFSNSKYLPESNYGTRLFKQKLQRLQTHLWTISGAHRIDSARACIAWTQSKICNHEMQFSQTLPM